MNHTDCNKTAKSRPLRRNFAVALLVVQRLSAPREGDALDLHWHTLSRGGAQLAKAPSPQCVFWRLTLRQLLHGNARARWLVREVLLVYAVHFGEVVHGSQEGCDLEAASQCIEERTHHAARRTIGDQ